MTIEAVLVDWAGTVTVPMHEMVLSAAVELGFSEDDIATAFSELAEYFLSDDSPVHQAERGEIDDDELGDFLDTKFPGASQLLLDRAGPSLLNGADRPEMVSLLGDLMAADITVVLATNNFRIAQDHLANRYLDTGLVGAIVNSALVGVRKPDPRFYGLALEAAGSEPAASVFVDDQEANLLPAGDLGMTTVHVGPDPAAAIAEIRALVFDG